MSEPFVVKHYQCESRPILKGNGFDGLEIGTEREEAEEFVSFINALSAKLQAAERENKRYRKALLWIRSQLSCTLVPRNVWVKKLHGQIFMVCQTELEPE